MRVEVDDGDDIRVAVTHHARLFEDMMHIETRMVQMGKMVFVVSDWDVTMDGIYSCPHSDIRIWLPRSMSRGLQSLEQTYDPLLNFGFGGYRDPVPVYIENRPDIDILLDATGHTSWMIPRKGTIEVNLDLNMAFGNVTLESNSGGVSLE